MSADEVYVRRMVCDLQPGHISDDALYKAMVVSVMPHPRTPGFMGVVWKILRRPSARAVPSSEGLGFMLDCLSPVMVLERVIEHDAAQRWANLKEYL